MEDIEQSDQPSAVNMPPAAEVLEPSSSTASQFINRYRLIVQRKTAKLHAADLNNPTLLTQRSNCLQRESGVLSAFLGQARVETPGLKKDVQLAMYAINKAEDAIEIALQLAQRERDKLELQKEQRRNMPKSSFSQWPGDILTWPRLKKDALKVCALVPESKDQYKQVLKIIGPQEWKERARFFENSEDPVTGILSHFELMLPNNTSALPTLEKRITELSVSPQDVPAIVSNAQVILGVIN